jgi:hypothetical protein
MAQRIQIHASEGSQIIMLNSPLRKFVEGQVGLHQRKFTLLVLLVSKTVLPQTQLRKQGCACAESALTHLTVSTRLRAPNTSIDTRAASATTD